MPHIVFSNNIMFSRRSTKEPQLSHQKEPQKATIGFGGQSHDTPQKRNGHLRTAARIPDTMTHRNRQGYINTFAVSRRLERTQPYRTSLLRSMTYSCSLRNLSGIIIV